MIAQKILKKIRKYFVTGMIVIIPIWVTILILRAVANLIQSAFDLLPPSVHPRTYISFFGIELVIALVLILIIGLLASNFFGKKFLKLGEWVLTKIPVIKTVYQGVKHLTVGVLGEKQMFSKFVLLEFPIKGLSFIGFVTGEDTHLIHNRDGKKMLKIFIPTTPNPTSGFFCIASEEEVTYLEISVDEAFKLIISAGYSNLQPG
ncbi:MAG: DUF502 domain-containing protein [Candidatus Aminicenantes bacterium]|nr:MAG: DUF502 domain-containing protein [Candidatus Aminicenantes bacterium]